MTAPLSGATVGGWTLGDALGSGGIAAVFRATHEDGRLGAIKVLHPSSLGTDEVKRFHREYRALARLDHPNIVRVYETGVVSGYPWIAMELVEGRDLEATLESWAAEEPADRWVQVERIVRGLCGALGYIHELGLVHRDLKPSNVLLGADGQAKLGDFGVVKDRHAHTTALTRHGDLIGTVAFMAPEQILDEPVDARTDLYALGAVLYVMLTDRRPIQAESVTGFLARHIAHVPPAPSAVRSDVPARLEAVCQRLLLKDRTHRFQSAASVRIALDQASGGPSLPMRGRHALQAAWRERISELRAGRGGLLALTAPPWSGRTFALTSLLASTDLPAAQARASDRNPITTLLEALEGASDQPPSRHLRALASSVRGAPHVLAIDDLHRADPRIVEAIARLARKLIVQEEHPLLVVYTATCRAHPVLEPLAAEALGAERWRLGPLERRAFHQMFKDRGLRGGAAGVLARRLHQDMTGRPGAAHLQLESLQQAGWLRRHEGRLVGTHAPTHFATEPLPVPVLAKRRLQRVLARLSPEALAATRVLALLGRPAPWALIQSLSDAPQPIVDELIEEGVWERVEEGPGGSPLRLALPWLGQVAVEGLSPAARKRLHRRIAETLAHSRRRSQAAEVARHFQACGQPGRAWPLYLRAARAAARDRAHTQVLSLCRQAREVEATGLEMAGPEDGAALRIRARQLEGEAYLARGSWEASLPPLEAAARLARAQNDTGSLAHALAAQGRAWYRLGRFEEAEPRLLGALRHGQASDPDRAGALRALADLQLRKDRLPESEELWREALSMARAGGSLEEEARALRGLAHLRALQGRLRASWELLLQAEDRLGAAGDARVQAGVLARTIELALAAAQYEAALHRSDVLLSLVERRDLEDRVLDAMGLRAEVLWAIGRPEDAHTFVSQIEARLHGAPVGVRLRTARQRARLGPAEEALAILPTQEDLVSDPIEDGPAQASAVRARALAVNRPDAARDLALWCLRRPRARLVLRHVDVHLDAGEALLLAGDRRAARRAAKAGLSHVSGAGGDGLRLELLSLFLRADPDPRIQAAFRKISGRVAAGLPSEIVRALQAREGFGTVFGGKA